MVHYDIQGAVMTYNRPIKALPSCKTEGPCVRCLIWSDRKPYPMYIERSPQSRCKVLVVAPTREEIERVAQGIREDLKQRYVLVW